MNVLMIMTWVLLNAPTSGETMTLVWTDDYGTEETVFTQPLAAEDYGEPTLFDVVPDRTGGKFALRGYEKGIENAPGKTAAETVESLCTTGSVTIVDASQVSVSSNVVNVGSVAVTLKPYYTAKIVEGALCVELNTNAVPAIAAGEDTSGETVEPIAIGDGAVSIGCTSQIGLFYQLVSAGDLSSLTGTDTSAQTRGGKQAGTGKALRLVDSAPLTSRRFYKVEVTDHK